MTQRRLPAEWEPQSGVMLTWPHANTDWVDMLEEVEACFINIAHEILKRQILVVVCPDKMCVAKSLNKSNISNLRLYELPSNDTWARDHGPITIIENDTPIQLDFTFNGWGLKFAANHDNLINQHLFKNQAFNSSVQYRNLLNWVMEGGSLESDGSGTVLTTSECLLSPNRNGGSSKYEIEQLLKYELGIKKVLWLNYGYLAGDDTDSHIDTLARLCDSRTIAYVHCENENDEHYSALKQMEDELKTFTNNANEKYKLVPLPMAEPVYFEGDRIPATYANFLIINGAVLLPTYNTKTDAQAVSQLMIAFPNHDIVPIDCTTLIKQHGSLHCVTMQFPEGVIQ